MPGQITENLKKKVAGRLAFYEDLGIRFFYRDRRREALFEQEKPVESLDNAMRPAEIAYQEPTLPKIPRRPGLQKVVSTAPSKMPPVRQEADHSGH